MESVLNTLSHAVDLSDGRPVLPGEIATNVEVDAATDPHNAGLVDDGTLLVLPSAPKDKTPPPPPPAATEDDKSKGAAQ